ncbi:MAG: hypothetical protein IJT68_09680 [Lentisphaeria bacterium]|nr:hypothetical protein [Lentisphaeria bacterium]
MKIHFIDFSTFKEHVAESLADCRNETESNLWQMHEQIESEEWKLGKTLAVKIG